MSFKQKSPAVITFAVLIALILAVMNPLAAMAQDEVPPQTESPTQVQNDPVADVPVVEDSPTETPAEVHNDAADTPAVADSTVEASTPADPTVGTTVAEDSAAEGESKQGEQTIVNQLPEGTDLVVLDQSGTTLPLVSNDTVTALAAPDPYFTVSGVTYQFTATDCNPDASVVSPCDDPIQAAVDYLSGTLKATPDDGNIYVESGTYNPGSGSGLVINGADWVFAGGSIPGNLGLVGAGSGTTIYNGSLNVFLSNNFTLSGFTFNNYVTVIGDNDVNMSDVVVDGTNSDGGIDIETYGNVDLNKVTSIHSSDDGADIYTNGDVNVAGSNFNDNRQNGLYIDALGSSTLNDVTANGNLNNGAVVSSGDITVNGGDYSSNGYGECACEVECESACAAGDVGLVLSGDTVAVNNVTANDNHGSGMWVMAYAGDITLSDVVANGNLGSGAVAATLFEGDITVNGGEFSSNGSGEDDGLRLASFAGNLILNNVTVTDNQGGGFWGGALGTITVKGGNFSGNIFGGISASANGGVTLDHVTVSDNKRDGIYAWTDGAEINVLCGSYTGNDGYGLQLDPNGGNVNLNGPVLTGNTDGEDNLLSAGSVSFGECPKPVPPIHEDPLPSTKGNKNSSLIPTTGQICDGERKVALNIGTGLGFFTNLCGLTFQLEQAENDGLPGMLPDGTSYVAGMSAKMSIDGKSVDTIPAGGQITLKFPVPEGKDGTSLAVLFWDGSKWVEVSGEVVDGFYVIEATGPGTYVLVTR